MHCMPHRLPLQDYLALEDVARRLARRYPPDWLERQGQQVHAATLFASFALAIVLGLAWGPWWGFLLPIMLPLLVLVILPRSLFGREAGRPRWAHPLAVLERHEVELLERCAAPAQGRALSGEHVFTIWRQARSHIDHHHG